jgi:excisionase family DNA binding protein
MKMDEFTGLLDVKEAARLLGISPGTAYHWISQGRLPVVRLSARCIRFRQSDLDTWLAEKVVVPQNQT